MTNTLSVPGYKIDRLLAKGGMAEVYLAEQLSLGRQVAIKVLDAHAGDAEFSERFLSEARLVAALSHTNLITIYDFGKLDNNKLFLSMEYLRGGDLEERLVNGITEKAAVINLRQLASMLSFVHRNNVIHRDIKPANILFRQDDTLVLTDFGIAKKVNNDVGLTQAGMMVGSPAYSSPEQLQGMEVDQRADIYSVGVVFLEMLSGNNPFKADTFINTAMNHVQMEIPQLDRALSRYQPLLDKMLAKKPKDRFTSMGQLIDMLDALQVNNETPAAPGSTITTNKLKTLVPKQLAPLQTAPLQPIEAKKSPTNTSRHRPLPSNLLDDDDNDTAPAAFKQNTGTHKTSSQTRLPVKNPATPSDLRTGQTGGFRTRPLPGNLLDDDDDEWDALIRDIDKEP